MNSPLADRLFKASEFLDRAAGIALLQGRLELVKRWSRDALEYAEQGAQAQRDDFERAHPGGSRTEDPA